MGGCKGFLDLSLLLLRGHLTSWPTLEEDLVTPRLASPGSPRLASLRFSSDWLRCCLAGCQIGTGPT